MIHDSQFSIRNLHRVFFYLLVLFLPSQLGFHFWPSWSFVLGRRIDYLSPTLFFTDILILLTLISWIVFRPIHTNIFSIRKVSLYILFGTFAILNSFLAISPAVAGYHWLKVFEFVLLGVYIVKTKPNIIHVTYCLSAALLYSSVLAIWQFALQHTVGGLWWFLGERTFGTMSSGIAQVPVCVQSGSGCPLFLRSYATFPHPNVLGAFLALTIPLIILMRTANKYISLGKWLCIGLGLPALVFTYSRSAWIIGSVLIFLSALQTKNRFVANSNKKKLINHPGYKVAGIIMIICLIIFVTRSFHLKDESVVVREQLNVSAVNIWKTSPILGVGLGNFLVALPSFLPSRTIYFLQPVHNIYLLILSETGIIGMGIALCLCFIFLKQSRKFKNLHNSANGATYIVRFSLLALLLMGLVDHYPVTLQQGQLLLTLFAGLSLILQ